MVTVLLKGECHDFGGGDNFVKGRMPRIWRVVTIFKGRISRFSAGGDHDHDHHHGGEVPGAGPGVHAGDLHVRLRG